MSPRQKHTEREPAADCGAAGALLRQPHRRHRGACAPSSASSTPRCRSFGEHGYERSTIERISQLAGCSRVSFYQYFSGKEDVFRHLAAPGRPPAASVGRGAGAADAGRPRLGGPARRGSSATATSTPATSRCSAPSAPPPRATRHWPADPGGPASGTSPCSSRSSRPPPSRLGSSTRSSGSCSPAPPARFDMAAILRSAPPDAYPRERVEVALTDVIHRALFGLAPRRERPRRAERGPAPAADRRHAARASFERAAELERGGGADRAAGPSRRCSRSATTSSCSAATRARGSTTSSRRPACPTAPSTATSRTRTTSSASSSVPSAHARCRRRSARSPARPTEPPSGGGSAATTRCTRRRARWSGSGWRRGLDDPLRTDRAAVFDWGRRRVARVLQGRDFGDADADAVALLAFVEAFGVDASPSRWRSTPRCTSCERGFLGRLPTPPSDVGVTASREPGGGIRPARRRA